VWGGLHGLYLWIEKFFRDRRTVDPNAIAKQHNQWIGFFYALLTFMLVNITWVFFRSDSFGKSWQMLSSMFGLASDGKALLTTLAIIKVAVVVPLIVLFHWFMRNTKVLDVAYKLSWWSLSIIWSVLLLLLIWAQESGSSFIYFQF